MLESGYQIGVYVPESHVEIVKEKMFDAGAGKLGLYDRCSFEYKGIGQYRPLSGSDPFLGSELIVEKVSEFKIEMICKKEFLQDVIAALKASHPYEMPAYYVIGLVNI
jgi:hypothetical protein